MSGTKSIKITTEAHQFLLYLKPMGINMQDWASAVLIEQFAQCYPEEFQEISRKLEPSERHRIDSQTSDETYDGHGDLTLASWHAQRDGQT